MIKPPKRYTCLCVERIKPNCLRGSGLKKVELKGPIWLMQPIPYFGELIGEDWIYEPKIDGWRVQIIRYGTLLDAELTTKEGIRFIPSVFAAAKKVEPIIYVFDIVFYNDQFVGDKTLKERKELLKTLSFKPPFYLVRYKKVRDLKRNLWDAVKKDNEGIVIKRLSSLI